MKFNNMKIKILLTFVALTLWSVMKAQEFKITGTVSDEQGPLVGVNVAIKDSKTGTITDINGSYSIQAKQNSTLTFTYIGYTQQNIEANGRNKIDVKLSTKNQDLEELVVVGYGTMKKRDVTGSITSISSKEIENSQPTNLTSAIQGKVPGLEIISTSEPGQSSNFKLRGTSTLSSGGSDPLFIVDGAEVSNIDNINPKDIASVEVLKDAASAAIYGSKSANGVIIITTKTGNSLIPKIAVSYTAKQSQIAHRIPQMNRLEAIKYLTLRNYYQGSYAIANRDSLNPAFTSDYNYQDLLFRKATTNQVDANISGAEKKMKYLASMGFLNENGIQLNTYNKRLTSRLNMDYKATDKLSIGSRASFAMNDMRVASSGSRSVIMSRPSYFSIYEPDGSYTPPIYAKLNPMAVTMLGATDYNANDITLTEFLEYKFSKYLSFKSSINGRLFQKNSTNFFPAILDESSIAKSNSLKSTTKNWTHDDAFTYNRKINRNSNLLLLGGFSLQENSTDITQISSVGNVSESIISTSAFSGVNLSLTQSTWTANRMASFFARASYDYKGRYLLNSNFRYDGSSRFGSSNRWGAFPSVSFGWRFSDERFMKWSKTFLTDSKLRVSYGVTGNQTTGDFASYDLYSTNYYADYVGLYRSQLSNSDLSWERTTQLNLGSDFNFLNGKINLTMDYYNKNTSNVLYLVAIPQTNGLSSSYNNIGSVSNNGFEFTINAKIFTLKDFDWSSSLNISFNRNVITSIPEGGTQYANNVYIIDKGYAVGTMYGWKRMEIFSYDQSNAFNENWNQLTPIFDAKDHFVGYELNGNTYTGIVKQLRYGSSSGTVFKGGDVHWDDVNHDGVIDANDREVIGCGQPDFTGGCNNEFRYKNFTLSAFFSFVVGGDIFSEYEYLRSNHKGSAQATTPNPNNIENSWLAPGDVALFPKPDATSTLDNTREASNLWIYDGSYIRLKTLKIGYNLPKRLVKKMKMENVNINIQMQNFLTWTNYPGFDPEILSSGFLVGYDYTTYPKAKDVLMGINLNF